MALRAAPGVIEGAEDFDQCGIEADLLVGLPYCCIGPTLSGVEPTPGKRNHPRVGTQL
jgi:hypothetical protein